MKISQTIEEAIKSQGRTKIWVSEQVDIRYKTFVDKLKNDRFDAYEFLKICNVLGIDVSKIQKEIK